MWGMLLRVHRFALPYIEWWPAGRRLLISAVANPHEGKSVFANQVSVGVEKPEFGFIVHGNILITCLAAVAFDDLKPDALLFEVMTALRTRTSEGHIIEGGRERHGT